MDLNYFLILRITIMIKEIFLLNTNFINPSYNDMTLCISLCATRKQHITLGDRRGKFSAFYTNIKAAHLPKAEDHLLVSFS